MKKMDNKGNIGGVQGFILGIVGIGVVLTVGLIVMGELRDTTTTGSHEYNASNDILVKMATIPTWIGILIVVAMAFLVLGYFYKAQ